MRGAFQNQGQRAGPEGVDQSNRFGGNIRRPVADIGLRRQVHDHRMVGRAALGGIDFRDRLRIFGIGAEAVHGLGRECHQFALLQQARGGSDRRPVLFRHLLRHVLFHFSASREMPKDAAGGGKAFLRLLPGSARRK